MFHAPAHSHHPPSGGSVPKRASPSLPSDLRKDSNSLPSLSGVPAMRTSARTLAFVLANTIAVLVALYLAFASDLARPYWSMFTVFVVARPIAGAVRSKAVFRFIGTLLGAAVSLLLIPPLVQAPVLLCTATSLWIALCVYLALLDRRPRNYAFLLAGYTATIVGLAVVDAPETIFDTSVARLEEISLGLVCAAVAHSVIFPQNILDELLERAERATRKSAAWLAEAISRPANLGDVRDEQLLAAFVSDLHLLYDHVAFETSNVPREAGLMRVLQDRFAWLLPRVSGIQQALVALKAENQLSPAAEDAVAKAAHWARAFAGTRATPAELRDLTLELRAACARLAAETPAGDAWTKVLKDSVSSQLQSVVTDLADAERVIEGLKTAPAVAPGALLEFDSSRRPRSMHRDRGLAILSAAAAAAATLIACFFWIEGSWPEGGVAAQFAAIGCSLFATLDRPSKVIFSAVVGILIALPLAAVYQFAIFPRIDGFASLALVLLPPVLLFSWMQASERLEGVALVLAIAFSGGLALSTSYAPNFAAFVNSNTAEIVGLLIAAITNLLFRTIDPIWNAIRIARAGWRSVTELALRPKMDIGQWVLEMFDRLGLVTGRLLSAQRVELVASRLDVLRDIRVGINLASLRQSRALLGGGGNNAAVPVLNAVAEAYEGLQRGRSLADSQCAVAIDAGIAALSGQPSSRANQDALRALAGLRLDLAPFGSRFHTEVALP